MVILIILAEFFEGLSEHSNAFIRVVYVTVFANRSTKQKPKIINGILLGL